jgi:hypothetical protein
MKSSDRVLIATALAAFAWVVLRAASQAITIDEATTYLLFVGPEPPLLRLGSTNNHVLNSMLMWLSTRTLGLSEFTARIPALLGAAIYITACVRFCRRIDGEWWLRWIALVCLIGSPFVMDYLVAARGYGLALGFLMMLMLADFRTLRGCAFASVFGALCLASNFSFALAALSAGAVLLIRTLRETKLSRWQSLAAYLLPGLAVTYFISLPAILNFPRQELWYGAHSLHETFTSIMESQMFPLLPGLALLSIVWLAYNWRRLPPLTLQFGATFLLTLALHAVAFHTMGLLYPFDRTALFFVPLFLGTIFAAVAIPGAPLLRYLPIAALAILALSNLRDLRRDYFEEWPWDRDTDQIYAKLACLHDRDHVDRVASGWMYMGALNFYREAHPGASRFHSVVDEREAPANNEVFVIQWNLHPAIVEQRHLTPIWTSQESPAQIAVPPEQLDRLKGSSCVAP